VHVKSPARRLTIEAMYTIWKAVGIVGRARRRLTPAPERLAFGVPAAGSWRRRRKPGQLPIGSDHFFVFLSVLTTSAPELPEFRGQN
jgi:hypothetical protein